MSSSCRNCERKSVSDARPCPPKSCRGANHGVRRLDAALRFAFASCFVPSRRATVEEKSRTTKERPSQSGVEPPHSKGCKSYRPASTLVYTRAPCNHKAEAWSRPNSARYSSPSPMAWAGCQNALRVAASSRSTSAVDACFSSVPIPAHRGSGRKAAGSTAFGRWRVWRTDRRRPRGPRPLRPCRQRRRCTPDALFKR